MFVNIAKSTVMITARNLLNVFILASFGISYVRTSVTESVFILSLKYANSRLMSSIFFRILENWRNHFVLGNFHLEIFSYRLIIFKKCDDFP